MTVKQQLHNAVEQLPESCTWDDALYRLYVQRELEAGSEDVRNGDVISDEEARRRFEKWLID